METLAFEQLLQTVLEELFAMKQRGPTDFISYQASDAFEELVYDITVRQCAALPVAERPQVHYTRGSHSFPDIVLEYPSGCRKGIEVKSSVSAARSWRTNGNSILGTTRDENVEDIYILFGKLSQELLDFRIKKYEHAVSTISVTHSPRYILDMELAQGENFFEQSGISFEELAACQDPIGRVSAYFAGEGKRAWWIAESAPPVIQMLGDLPKQRQKELVGYGFAHFPEVLSSNFYNFAAWLASNQSIVSYNLRDIFTAGGRGAFSVPHPTSGHPITVSDAPRILITLWQHEREVKQALQQATPLELSSDWETLVSPGDTLEDKLMGWRPLAQRHLEKQNLNENSENIQDILAAIFPIV